MRVIKFKKMMSGLHPAIPIIFAGFLWGVDSVVRSDKSFDLQGLIFYEYLVGTLVFLPYAYKQNKGNFTSFTLKEWSIVGILGLGVSALGSLIYLLSLHQVSSASFGFLQVFQPLVVILLARILLKETMDDWYPTWAFWMFISAILLNFPSFQAKTFFSEWMNTPKEMGLALVCMILWGAGTIGGKKLLENHSPSKIAFWRWLIATAGLGLVLGISGKIPSPSIFGNSSFLLQFLIVSTLFGSFAMAIYYQGLKKISAGVTSFLELSFPFFTMLLSGVVSFGRVDPVQILGFFSMGFALLLLIKIKDQAEEV